MLFTKKPSTCKCGYGGFRTFGHRWRVIERGDKSSKLKCLDCGWKWWSRRKYVAELDDHTEQSRSGMTDHDIITRLAEGTLRVDLETAKVESLRNGTWRELKVIERESNGSTYRFVQVTYQGKMKKIALHRLVWMAGNMDVVPEGLDVDHIRGKVSDAFSNLRLLPASINRSIGRPESVQDETLPF